MPLISIQQFFSSESWRSGFSRNAPENSVSIIGQRCPGHVFCCSRFFIYLGNSFSTCWGSGSINKWEVFIFVLPSYPILPIPVYETILHPLSVCVHPSVALTRLCKVITSLLIVRVGDPWQITSNFTSRQVRLGNNQCKYSCRKNKFALYFYFQLFKTEGLIDSGQ